MVQPASASAVVVLIDDSALCLLGRCYVSANGDTHACWHVRSHALTHVSADWVAVVGRSGSDIPFITSYYFPLSPAAAAAAAAVIAPTALFFSSYVSSLFLESNRLLKTGSALAGRKSSRRDFPPFTHKAFTSGKSSASVRFELFLKNSWMHSVAKKIGPSVEPKHARECCGVFALNADKRERTVHVDISFKCTHVELNCNGSGSSSSSSSLRRPRRKFEYKEFGETKPTIYKINPDDQTHTSLRWWLFKESDWRWVNSSIVLAVTRSPAWFLQVWFNILSCCSTSGLWVV